MTLKSTPAGGALVLTIDRPPVNALDLPTIETLRKTFATVAANPPKDGVVLTGAGERAFCAGADMKNSGNKSGLEYWAAARTGGLQPATLNAANEVAVQAFLDRQLNFIGIATVIEAVITKSTGRINSTIGNSILTPALATIASARRRRRMRRASA